MYSSQPKKLLIINILEILKKHSDEEHRLSQKEIIDILKRDYEMSVDRKAVKRNLVNLIEFGYPIEYSEKTRIKQNGETETLYYNWYLENDFSNAELRLVIDSLLFSKHIPNVQRNELINKIVGLSNKYFKSKVNHIRCLNQNTPENKQLFYNIETIDEAIDKNKKIEFIYNDYGLDKKLHPRMGGNNKCRKYVVSPYQMVATNGKYYLICNYDHYNNIDNYRIDRITDIHLLDASIKPIKNILGTKTSLNLPTHVAEHIYMKPGKSEIVSFSAKKYLVSELFDWFGNDMQFSHERDDEVTVTVKVNLEAMRCWLLQYARHVKVISPVELVETIKQDLQNAIEKYK